MTDGLAGYEPGDHLMLRGDVAITFRFLNPLVVELLAIYVGLRFTPSDGD